jgi:hypothetical protein
MISLPGWLARIDATSNAGAPVCGAADAMDANSTRSDTVLIILFPPYPIYYERKADDVPVFRPMLRTETILAIIVVLK